MDTFGHRVGVVAARTLSPHCFGVRSTPGFWQLKACMSEVAQRYGSPATIAPPANTSGYDASMTAAIAPPADRPVTNTRPASEPRSLSVRSTICLIDNASPEPRAVSDCSNQLKHLLELLADCCSGNTSAKPSRSANATHPGSSSYAVAD